MLVCAEVEILVDWRTYVTEVDHGLATLSTEDVEECERDHVDSVVCTVER